MFLELYFKLTCLWFLATLSMPTLGLLIRKDQMSLLNHCFLFSWCKIKVQFKILHYFRHIFPHSFSIPHEDFVPLKQRTSQYILYKKKVSMHYKNICSMTQIIYFLFFLHYFFYILSPRIQMVSLFFCLVGWFRWRILSHLSISS